MSFNFNPGSAIGGVADAFSWDNPSDAASPYLKQITPQSGKYLDPYSNEGKADLPIMHEQLMQLINNPAALEKMIGAGYQQSPGYQFNVDQATTAAKNMAAAGGMSGSLASQESLAKTVSGLASQDYSDYLNRVLGQYNKGLTGLDTSIGRGLTAGTSMADIIAKQKMAEAENAYGGQRNENNHWSDVFSNLGGSIGLGQNNSDLAGWD